MALLHIHRLEQVKKIRYLNRRRLLLYEKDFLWTVRVTDCDLLLLDNPVVRKLYRSGCHVREKEHPTQCAQCVLVCCSHIRLHTVRLLWAVRSSAHSTHFSNVEGLFSASLQSRPLSVPQRTRFEHADVVRWETSGRRERFANVYVMCGTSSTFRGGRCHIPTSLKKRGQSFAWNLWCCAVGVVESEFFRRAKQFESLRCWQTLFPPALLLTQPGEPILPRASRM